jgi:hypothetical protein
MPVSFTVNSKAARSDAPPQTPHLHFTIFKLAADKRWWQGAPINPFPLWAAS